MFKIIDTHQIYVKLKCLRYPSIQNSAVFGMVWGHRHSPIQQKNGPLTTEIVILNLERMTQRNFNFIGKKWKMVHTIVFPSLSLRIDRKNQ